MNAPRRSLARVLIPLLAALSSACASVEFERETETSGTFRSTGLAFTLLSYDFPKGALMIARENAADSEQPNLLVEDEMVLPYLGPVDWLLDIIGLRYAKVEGTWGFPSGQQQN